MKNGCETAFIFATCWMFEIVLTQETGSVSGGENGCCSAESCDL